MLKPQLGEAAAETAGSTAPSSETPPENRLHQCGVARPGRLVSVLREGTHLVDRLGRSPATPTARPPSSPAGWAPPSRTRRADHPNLKLMAMEDAVNAINRDLRFPHHRHGHRVPQPKLRSAGKGGRRPGRTSCSYGGRSSTSPVTRWLRSSAGLIVLHSRFPRPPLGSFCAVSVRTPPDTARLQSFIATRRAELSVPPGRAVVCPRLLE